MRNIIANPPNIDKIRAVLPYTRPVLFAYGDIIYNPSGAKLDAMLVAHEEVHEQQQKEMGIDPWWDLYIKDPAFRAQQEVPAFRRQYEVSKLWVPNRLIREKYFEALAHALSSDTYGNCISLSEARAFLK